ncbi:MAG: hypothetical protein ACT4PO_01835 [Actinomycetota bacterium]
MRYIRSVVLILTSCLLAIGLLPSPAPATFPGSNGKVFFSSFRDGNFEIYRMKPSGAGQTNLTNDPADDYAAAVSQDASKVVFVSERDGDPEIFVMNADGSEPTQLTSNETQDFGPEFTPDGRIVFVSDRDGNFEIYIMDADGQNQSRLTNNTAIDLEPTVAPDGTLIAWASFRDLDYEVFTMGIDGSNETQLTFNTATDGSPDFAPDGSAIAFHSSRDGGDFEIYRMGADGTNQTRLTASPGLDFAPAHSPNGLRLMWASQRTGDVELWVASFAAAASPHGPLGLLPLPEQVTDSAGIDAEATWARRPEADLKVTKACDGPVKPGDTIRCTIVVKNLGPDPSGIVTVTDEVNHSLEVPEATLTSLRTDEEDVGCRVDRPSEGLCTSPSLEPGQRLEIRVRIKVSAGNYDGLVINCAKAKAAEYDPKPGNNKDCEGKRVRS